MAYLTLFDTGGQAASGTQPVTCDTQPDLTCQTKFDVAAGDHARGRCHNALSGASVTGTSGQALPAAKAATSHARDGTSKAVRESEPEGPAPALNRVTYRL